MQNVHFRVEKRLGFRFNDVKGYFATFRKICRYEERCLRGKLGNFVDF